MVFQKIYYLDVEVANQAFHSPYEQPDEPPPCFFHRLGPEKTVSEWCYKVPAASVNLRTGEILSGGSMLPVFGPAQNE